MEAVTGTSDASALASGISGWLPAVTDLRATAPSLADTLEPFRGSRVYFEPLAGNNGDDLIRFGTERELARLGFELVEDPARADLLLINGGGGMNDIWKVGFDRLGPLAKHATKPLVVCPSSYMFETTRLVDLLGERSAPTTLYCRERVSVGTLLEQLNGYRGEVSIGIDHDMALRLRGSDLLGAASAGERRDHILVVDRGDAESQTGASVQKMKAPKGIKGIVPASLRAPIKRFVNRKLQGRAKETSRFAQEAARIARELLPEFADQPTVLADLSMRDVASFDEWVNITKRSSVVFSTRLHGAILPALLDIPTFIRAGGIPKFRGVYELSLRHLSHVKMIDESGAVADDSMFDEPR